MEDILRIGIDDTDSKRTMCTTYVAVKALQELERAGFRRADYPWLIRLNPNCPYKTRGNAALCVSIHAEPANLGRIAAIVSSAVERWADLESDGTDPGIVLAWKGQAEGLRDIYWRALREIIDPAEARRRCEELGIRYLVIKEGRGVVGAAAAAGADPDSLRTFEAIAYRVPAMWGLERRVDEKSVIEMDKSLAIFTFDNYDYEKREVRITPHTPCPVLAGVRSITPQHAEEGLKMVRFLEPVDFFEVFKTNQAEDLHYLPARICDLLPNGSYAVRGIVVSKPAVKPGGHVFVNISDGTGEVTLAAFEPTGSFRRVVEQLVVGDEVLAYGGFKVKGPAAAINLEKLAILRLAKVTVKVAPTCNLCGRRMKSMGRSKGYRCERCGVKRPEQKAVEVDVDRRISEGIYEVCVSARRHLAMPLRIVSFLRHDEHRQS
ncbi:MAG: tRNA(Ile)(2)-agmatinylcytidine synthase [Nitrososphaerota archaeon]|nr:tRNA(Ile)(2)-agmatinylcytidine synthase [Candidatus Calditenuaceae archaeon]MDW8073049.1 tRNA(Ile)(2)-agmatinylcytidine synthase [Nitrososphaerota archaeon]